MRIDHRYAMELRFEEIKRSIRDGVYRLIGSGSGRLVYDLENGYVAKVAKNQRGLAQNRVEYKISQENYSEVFARITDASEDLRILIMEKAEQVSFEFVLRYYGARSERALSRIPDIRNAMRRYDLVFVDLCRVRNWGLVHGKPVIIDYGFTRLVRSKYYYY